MANEFVARKGIISPKLTTTLNASSKTLTISGETTYSSTNAQVVVTNGHVHIDPCTGFNLYLNYYTGTSIYFGNGGPANVSSTGAFTGISFNSITALSSTTPAALGVAAVGSSTTVARADHVHLLPTLATLGAVGGSGTINYIPKFTSTTALGNSRITDDATWIYLSSNSVNVGQSPSYINITSNWIQVTSGGTCSVYGTLTCSGDIIAYFSSDDRLKDNKILIPNALDKINQIGGYEFDWNDKQTTYYGHDIGVIAQEVEKVLPELVITRDNGYKAVKYEKIVALLIEAIKEQQIQIDKLNNKIIL